MPSLLVNVSNNHSSSSSSTSPAVNFIEKNKKQLRKTSVTVKKSASASVVIRCLNGETDIDNAKTKYDDEEDAREIAMLTPVDISVISTRSSLDESKEVNRRPLDEEEAAKAARRATLEQGGEIVLSFDNDKDSNHLLLQVDVSSDKENKSKIRSQFMQR